MLINLAPPHKKKIKNTLLRLKILLNEPQREHNSGLAALKRPPSRKSLAASIQASPDSYRQQLTLSALR